MASGFAKRVNSHTCLKSDKLTRRRRTLTPPAAPLSLLQSQKGEGAGCDDGTKGARGQDSMMGRKGQGDISRLMGRKGQGDISRLMGRKGR